MDELTGWQPDPKPAGVEHCMAEIKVFTRSNTLQIQQTAECRVGMHAI